MADFKLASQKATGAGNPATIKARTISRSQVGGADKIKAPMINKNSANVKYTNMPVPDIFVDTSLDTAVKQMDNMTRAAFAYNDRRETAQAEELSLSYNNQLRTAYMGEAGPDGKIQGGYANTQLADAQASFADFNEAMDSAFNRSLDGVGSGVKAKAISQMSRTRDQYKDRATSHNVKQFELYERDLQVKDKQAITQEIVDFGTEAWTNGTVQRHKSTYKTAAEAEAAISHLATTTMQSAYSKAYEAALEDPMDRTPTVTAAAAAERAYDKIEDQLEGDTKNSAMYNMNKIKASAQKTAKADANERQEKLRMQLSNTAVETYSETMKAGNFSVLGAQVAGYRMQFDDKGKASNLVVKHLANAVAVEAGSMTGTYFQKKNRAEELANEIVNNVDMSQPERMAFLNEATMNIPKQMWSEQEFEDSNELVRMTAFYESYAKEKGGLPPQIPFSNTGHLKNAKLAEVAYQKTKDWLTKGPDGSTEGSRKAVSQTAAYLQETGMVIPPDMMRKLAVAAAMKNIPMEDFQAIKANNEKLKLGQGNKEPFKKYTGYKRSAEMISKSEYFRMDRNDPRNIEPDPDDYGGDNPSAGEEADYNLALLTYEMAQYDSKAQAQKSLNDFARKAGGDFNMEDWWIPYVKNTLNKGSITKPDIVPVEEKSKAKQIIDLSDSLMESRLKDGPVTPTF